MDQIFGRVTFKSRHSIADSIMMWILRSAMDRAHEKVRSKEGVIGRLNEISKFYELALMQLDGCQKFVQEEADSSLESSDEEVIGELAEIRERLQWRLKASELAIEEKDRELNERLDNEFKLRRALEIKHRELDLLRTSLDLERRKSDGLEELAVLGNTESVDETISDLKILVDQQVSNIKQKLEVDGDLLDRRMEASADDVEIEGMRSDIDILKETMDIAFGRMQNAILMTELEPVESQLEHTTERDTVAILIKGFMADIEENVNARVRRKEREILTEFRKRFEALFKEVTSLRDELGTISELHGNFEGKSFFKAIRSKSEADTYGSIAATFEVGLAEQMKQDGNKNLEDDESHFVAKMIKSHESIIRRKSGELNWLKRQIILGKGSTYIKREEDSVDLRGRIRDVITRLENFINWSNAELGHNIACEGDEEDEMPLARMWGSNNEVEREKYQNGSFEDAWKKANTLSISHVADGLCNEIQMQKEVKEAKDLQSMAVDQVRLTPSEGCDYKFHCDSYELEILLRERMLDEFLNEMVSEWNEKLEGDKVMDQIGEEIFAVVISLAMKNHGASFSLATVEKEQWRARCDHLEDLLLEKNICEGTLRTLFREMHTPCNEIIMESNGTDRVAERDISLASREETTICLECAPSDNMSGFNHSLSEKSLTDVRYTIKEEVQMICLKEACKEWKNIVDSCSLEDLVRDRIFKLVVSEVLNQVGSITPEANKTTDHSGIPPNSAFPIKLHQNPVTMAEHNLVQKLASQLECTDISQESTCSEGQGLKVDGREPDHSGANHLRLNRLDRSKELLHEMSGVSIAVAVNISKALDQLTNSTFLLSELRNSLGIPVESETSCDETEIIDTRGSRMMPSSCYKTLEMMPVNNLAFTSLSEFVQAFEDFKSIAEDRIELQNLRVKEAKENIQFLSELVGSTKKKEILYKRAFVNRCESLKKAEAEVDLLADQVDVLLGILEHAYLTLHQHAPILKQFIPVLDILEMIEKELPDHFCANNVLARFAAAAPL